MENLDVCEHPPQQSSLIYFHLAFSTGKTSKKRLTSCSLLHPDFFRPCFLFCFPILSILDKLCFHTKVSLAIDFIGWCSCFTFLHLLVSLSVVWVSVCALQTCALLARSARQTCQRLRMIRFYLVKFGLAVAAEWRSFVKTVHDNIFIMDRLGRASEPRRKQTASRTIPRTTKT